MKLYNEPDESNDFLPQNGQIVQSRICAYEKIHLKKNLSYSFSGEKESKS